MKPSESIEALLAFHDGAVPEHMLKQHMTRMQYKKFLKFMFGKTYGLGDNNEPRYYHIDIKAFLAHQYG